VTDHQDVAEALAAERAATLERLGGLERELAGIIESSSAGADDEHDPEGATLAFERQHAAALLSQARQHVADLDAAMGRLADGSYGRCTACGEPIGAARLAARQAAETCIRCASRR
jgi:RNA polymerase-binding transcription factor DksA